MEFSDLSKQEKDRIDAAARALQNMAWSYVIPLRIITVKDNAEVAFNSATGFVMRLNGHLYVGTAWHVVQTFMARRREGEDVLLLARDTPLEPLQVAFIDEPNDIVFLRLPDDCLANLQAEAYDPGPRWPPRVVTTDDVVLLCGLPAYIRGEPDSGEILFGDFSICQPVSSVGAGYFVLQMERENWENLGRVPMPGADVFLGGLSGAPVFVMDDLSYPLVGVVSQIGDTLPLLYVRTFNALPLTFEQPAPEPTDS